MSEQDKTATTIQCPTTNDPEAWKAYWNTKGQPWRTVPEIDAGRQKYLDERRSITPDIKQGIYPFKDIKLTRADVEWLLATHENGCGPIDWSDEKQRDREGLDLRGADLRFVDLKELPLACLQGSLKWNSLPDITQEQRANALVLLQGADLRRAHLEGATLTSVHLELVELTRVHLEYANLIRAHLEGASLWGGYIQRAKLIGTYLEGALLGNIILADESHVGPIVVDTQWNSTNLAIVNWAQVKMLGDDYRAQKVRRDEQKNKDKVLKYHEMAVRANRQLSVALQSQGLNEEAARFAYRAQKLQRVVLQLQKKFGQYIFSSFLDLLAGYGYRPGRSVIWYLIIIFGFALAYATFGHLPFLPDSLVFSLTSFHLSKVQDKFEHGRHWKHVFHVNYSLRNDDCPYSS